jgi:deferrochelatase/peroxidase EfeB
VSRFQDGIAVSDAAQPGRSFGLLCLNRAGDQPGGPAAAMARTRAALSRVWQVGRDLGRGVVPSFEGQADPEGLTVLVGYGPRLLQTTRDGTPAELAAGRFSGPDPAGEGSPILPAAALSWAPGVAGNPADCDVAVQLTAASEAAVSRAVVEIRRQLREVGGLKLAAFFPGYRRTDRRSWLGFHDGVANPDIDDRPDVLRIPDAAAPAWLAGGTYLAFLRVRVRLDSWDSLDPAKQELAVGRHRATGAALEVSPD